MLSVRYGNYVVSGQKLSIDTVRFPPIVTVESIATLYTLIMIDPDVSKPDYVHWLIVNNNKLIFTYEPPLKKHRYVFYLYKQEKEFNVTQESFEPYRNGFSINLFTKNNNLTYVTNSYFKLSL
jgi:phosphatidylethanolamine-binding protein (PEBP) family uncharacterized protein